MTKYILTFLLFLSAVLPTRAQELFVFSDNSIPPGVEESYTKGIRYLLMSQHADGSWSTQQKAGVTGLALPRHRRRPIGRERLEEVPLAHERRRRPRSRCFWRAGAITRRVSCEQFGLRREPAVAGTARLRQLHLPLRLSDSPCQVLVQARA